MLEQELQQQIIDVFIGQAAPLALVAAADTSSAADSSCGHAANQQLQSAVQALVDGLLSNSSHDQGVKQVLVYHQAV